VVVLPEDVEKTLRPRAGGSVTTGVSHGLAAASLLRGTDVEPRRRIRVMWRFQLGIKLVDVARYEKAHFGI